MNFRILDADLKYLFEVFYLSSNQMIFLESPCQHVSFLSKTKNQMSQDIRYSSTPRDKRRLKVPLYKTRLIVRTHRIFDHQQIHPKIWGSNDEKRLPR